MLSRYTRWAGFVSVIAALTFNVGSAAASGGWPSESKRLAQAKDLIAEEQWTRAIEVLKVAAGDPKETGRDEAIYWLAHSLYHAGDPAAALDAIVRLEQEFPSSLWVKPAGALRIEMAVRLRRNDVLWWTAVPPPPPPPPPAAPAAVVPPERVKPPAAPRKPAQVATSRRPPEPPMPPPPAEPAVEIPPAPPRPASVWIPEGFHPDIDQRIQALGYLIQYDADKVIPVLRQIALEVQQPGPAGRALFVLAQSGKPEARETVVQVAKTGPGPIRLVAVRELGRFGGPEISKELLQVYSMSDLAVKRQVVKSLGERQDQPALLTIVRQEKNPDLRNRAIVTLGNAGGNEALRVLYSTASVEMKRPIILGLFNARAEAELIEIATREQDVTLLNEIHTYLKMLGTPKSREYLQKVSKNR
jgi:hypothetical protein